ncbi:CRISPR-associated protein Cas4 [uncultured Thomasclavelia sp.]|uniref:CRISPR-associated protein Cas4 n=1 Tax=Candidatus Erysipelatoclostridium merdavium TaxID=2838566 RepID=A0A9D1XP46_9FIRM|nr:CRISPR-associated protein Cas4 [uncultured Thomasclavelia sp.]HIX82830.1 CRISPR-associated protein Cas4 [Candidatus Erysipelatoclostridium merdavium]
MKQITGTMYAYSYLCWRKLWFFAKDIVMEQENENVIIGKLIDQESYRREKKHLYLDDIVCIDIVKDNVICEIKKSSSQREMAIQQLKYYLYLLNKKGIEVKGELLVPKENHKEMIVLNENDILEIDKQLERIKKICNEVTPPEIINNKICKKCAYFELCYI